MQHAKCLTEDESKLLKHPLPLSLLQRGWKVLHDKLGYIPFADMDNLVQHNVLPAKFRKLKGKPMLCPSCMFGHMKKYAWQSKEIKNIKQIRKERDNYPKANTSTDQLVVAQPGLVPRLSGRHSTSRICGATGFVDHCTEYSYSSMQDSDQTLAATE